MLSLPELNRRQWLKTTVAGVAGLTVARNLLVTPARAQHEDDRTAKRDEPARLGGNENPYGPSPMAVMAIVQNADKAFRYATKEEATKLGDLLAADNKVKAENVVVGSGSTEILENYAKWLSKQGSGPGGEIVSALPGYINFTGKMKALGSTIVTVPLDDNMVHDLDAMAAKVGPNTKAVYICNPNNPTSTIVPPAKLKAFCIEISKKCPVFIDEAYLECSDNFAENTMAPLVAAGHNIIVARTFSKMYGLAGQRVGYGLMPAAVAKEVAALSETRLNKLGVLAATASLEEMTYVSETRAKIKAERDKLCATLKELKRKFPDPQGNFVFFHTGMPIATFQEKMAAENVMVARAFPPALDWCRMSIGSPEEMALAHAALRKVFA
jgi:histidinol-phosphate aminotransferase